MKRNFVILLMIFIFAVFAKVSFAGESAVDIGIRTVQKISSPFWNAAGVVKDVYDGCREIYVAEESARVEKAAKAVGKIAVTTAVESASVPVAVSVASTLGMTASTGTAISTLSGAAATSATLATAGAPASAILAGVGIVAAPVTVGGVIVIAVGAGVSTVVNWLIF